MFKLNEKGLKTHNEEQSTIKMVYKHYTKARDWATRSQNNDGYLFQTLIC